MDLYNNTVLITGGSSGIGLQLSRELVKKKNKVIICGRNDEKLRKAQQEIPELAIIQCDISGVEGCMDLYRFVKEKYPELNILINNAAVVHAHDFIKDENTLEKLDLEVKTNLIAPIHLIKLLCPIIKSNEKAHIVNITTGLIYAPRALYPYYNATKAALHSFTQVLRVQVPQNIKVVEVLFPAVKTPWHNGKPPKIAIGVSDAVTEMLDGLRKGKWEVKVGKVRLLAFLSRIAPNYMFKKINALENE
ncbi:MAG: SDR family NAD(P)-dependent oxidoreductase [Flavobacteriales bacterium]|jgi:uncharacterized oxidoreductase|nr:SDR family NAD(P)-dependent oxidoreductase [Flavobacteriales bacterium]